MDMKLQTAFIVLLLALACVLVAVLTGLLAEDAEHHSASGPGLGVGVFMLMAGAALLLFVG